MKFFVSCFINGSLFDIFSLAFESNCPLYLPISIVPLLLQHQQSHISTPHDFSDLAITLILLLRQILLAHGPMHAFLFCLFIAFVGKVSSMEPGCREFRSVNINLLLESLVFEDFANIFITFHIEFVKGSLQSFLIRLSFF